MICGGEMNDIEAELMRRLESFDLRKAVRKLQFTTYIKEERGCTKPEAKRLTEKVIKEKGYDWLEANFIICLDKKYGESENN